MRTSWTFPRIGIKALNSFSPPAFSKSIPTINYVSLIFIENYYAPKLGERIFRSWKEKGETNMVKYSAWTLYIALFNSSDLASGSARSELMLKAYVGWLRQTFPSWRDIKVRSTSRGIKLLK